MEDRCIPHVDDEDEFLISSSEESVDERELPSWSTRSSVLVESVTPSLRSEQKHFTNELAPDTLLRCSTRRNLTDASVPQIRRDLVLAWRSILALRVDHAVRAADQIEPQLDDLPPVIAARFRSATQLLRSAALALQDDSMASLATAMSLVRIDAADQDCGAASTLCRLGFWQLGNFDAFHSLPRQRPRVRWSTFRAFSALLDLSIDAAVALDHLHISTAKRLAADASRIADAGLPRAEGLAALPACITAQVLYEEGALDEADMTIRDRLPAINSEGSIECALRAYLVLTRIARHRGQCDFAALLLREAEALGERRGWPRLVAACLAERTASLLAEARTREARVCAQYLDSFADAHGTRGGHFGAEITRYRALARSRVSWADGHTSEAVAGMRQLYHRSIERQDLYSGCRLAVELAEMLVSIGECEEADALFFHTLRVGAAAGLYQLFLDGPSGSGVLLRRAHDRAQARASADGALLPFVGSLLLTWDTRTETPSAEPGGRTRDTLTPRERGILAMISQGFSNKRIARTFTISPETVKSHLKRIFVKLAVSTRTEAVSRAGSLGLL